MDFPQLQAFCLIAEKRSFSLAANELHITQPSISARIKQLEKELKYALFQRQGNRVELTAEGQAFLPYAQRMLRIQQLSVESLHKTHSHRQLTIGTTVMGSIHLFPDLIGLLQQVFPHVFIKIRTGQPHEVIHMVMDHVVDLAITAESVRSHTLKTFFTVEDPILLVGPKDHPLSKKDKVLFTDLRDEPFVMFDADFAPRAWQRIHLLFDSSGVEIHRSIEVDQTVTTKQLVVQGAGLAFLPSLMVRKELANGEMVAIPLEGLHISYPLTGFSRKGELPAEGREFIQQAEQFLQQYLASFYAP